MILTSSVVFAGGLIQFNIIDDLENYLFIVLV